MSMLSGIIFIPSSIDRFTQKNKVPNFKYRLLGVKAVVAKDANRDLATKNAFAF
ncbi:15182_t:CDS:1, partial [Acaulospora colombiana]